MKIAPLLLLVLFIPALLNASPESKYRLPNQSLAQPPENNDSLMRLFGKNKILPKGYERQALLALAHYPELKEVFIEFKLVKAKTPFTSRPTTGSTLLRGARKRHYLVLISTETTGWLEKIVVDKMPFEAQVGVLSHELAHTALYIHTSFFSMLGIISGTFSPTYLNKFEHATDQRTIDHGAGCYLLQWSRFVAGQLPAEVRNGPERYMRPETIQRILAERNQSCGSK